jgi:hypothetical protein
MVAMKYDMKAYLRMLLNTQAFARASTKEVAPGAPYYFQGPVFHRMTAEQVWDSLVASSALIPTSRTGAPVSVNAAISKTANVWPDCSTRPKPALLFEASKQSPK